MTTIQWVFSGIGVLLVAWAGTWIYRRFRPREQELTPAQVISNSEIVGPVAGRDINIGTYHGGNVETASDDYRPGPTPAEIRDSVSKVSLYASDSVTDNYRGIKGRWSGTLYSICKRRDDEIEVDLKVGSGDSYGLVLAIVKLSDYPILKTVNGGEPLAVTGTIDYVQTNGIIHLKEAKLRFI